MLKSCPQFIQTFTPLFQRLFIHLFMTEIHKQPGRLYAIHQLILLEYFHLHVYLPTVSLVLNIFKRFVTWFFLYLRRPKWFPFILCTTSAWFTCIWNDDFWAIASIANIPLLFSVIDYIGDTTNFCLSHSGDFCVLYIYSCFYPYLYIRDTFVSVYPYLHLYFSQWVATTNPYILLFLVYIFGTPTIHLLVTFVPLLIYIGLLLLFASSYTLISIFTRIYI